MMHMETKSHKRKTFMVTILIMIALVIAVGYAWFAYKHKLASLTKVNCRCTRRRNEWNQLVI